MLNIKLLEGDCRETLKTLPEQCVDTCVTSPPYFNLRDYGTAEWEGGDPFCPHTPLVRNARTAPESPKQRSNVGSWTVTKGDCTCGAKRIDSQIGLEDTPEGFVQQLVEVFREVRRVLRDDGTIWVNLGDTYAGNRTYQVPDSIRGDVGNSMPMHAASYGCKPKDLIGIPWMVAFALRNDGWFLRSDIIWHKLNPMPESVTDRPTKTHEYIFLLSKSEKYYYDAKAIEEPLTAGTDRYKYSYGGAKSEALIEAGKNGEMGVRTRVMGMREVPTSRNKRSVWSVPVTPYQGAHFATFPEDLIRPCIRAGSRPGGVVLDTFGGSGTTGRVALDENRSAILCELNPKYAAMIRERNAIVEGDLFFNDSNP